MEKDIKNYKNNYRQKEGQITSYECNSFGKKGLEIRNRSIQDFQGIIDDVKSKLKKIRKTYKNIYDEDAEFYPVKKAILKGRSIITKYDSLYFEDLDDNNLKIFICMEYKEFNDEYDLIKDKLI